MSLPDETKPGGVNTNSSVLVDQDAQEMPQAEEATVEDQNQTTDLAKLLGSQICRKAGLRQLFLSFSVDQGTTEEFSKNFRMMAETEQRLTGLLKSM